ncbi:MAG TPA: phage tail protein [Gemmatimonadaceae bacterium]|nr:phage tail protein [Gemmatimonadaceae bacterium]
MGTSSYLPFLPPVLWDRPPAAGELPLAATLRVFEKILTGIDDGVVVSHGAHDHEGLERVIEGLHHLFDARTVPEPFLAYLASWLGLHFPDIWDGYQRRKITGQIVQIYRARGLKAGLDRYLELYTVAATRPRIVVDDASKVLFMRPARGQRPPIYTIASQLPLVSPTCIVRSPDGALIVGELGPHGAGDEAIWRLLPDGQPPYSGAPPVPQRVGPVGWNLTQPVAVAVDDGAPWNLFVLDRVLVPGLPALYRLASPGLNTATTLATRAALGMVWPVAMTRDPATGHLLILDRGAIPGGGAAPPFILDVTPSPFNVVKQTMLNILIEPLSIAVLPGGDLLVGDAREQDQSGGNPPGTPLPPGNLVRITRGVGAWTGVNVLSAVPNGPNPLVAPMALALDDAGDVLVADLGLKAVQSPASPYVREVAEPAMIYRVTLGAVPTVERASETTQLVTPTGMAYFDGALYLTDRGEYADAALFGTQRDWRSLPHEFGVVLHFSLQRTNSAQRRRIAQDVREIIDTETAAHTDWTMVFGI